MKRYFDLLSEFVQYILYKCYRISTVNICLYKKLVHNSILSYTNYSITDFFILVKKNNCYA